MESASAPDGRGAAVEELEEEVEEEEVEEEEVEEEVKEEPTAAVS